MQGAVPWLSLDIETANGRPEEAERWMRLHWTPPANIKSPETIGRRYQEMLEEKRAKRALFDTAPVVVVSLASPLERRCLHCLREEPLNQHASGGWVEGFASRRAMLLALRAGLDAIVTPDTVIVGHNVRWFDLVRLRWSFVREGLRLPVALAVDEHPVFDTMREYGRRFSLVEKPFFALADLLDEFGLANHKTGMDGSMVPRYVEEGRIDELVAYALRDAAIEAELYLRMTGQVDDQPPAPETGA